MEALAKTALAATLFFTTQAYANGHPEFDQYQTSDVIPCESTGRVMYGFPLTLCLEESRPGKHVVRYQNRDTGEITMKEEETFEYIRCSKALNKCTDRAENYRGNFTAPRDTYYAIFKDFYVYPGADGKDYAYKTGTGPLFGGPAAGGTKTPPKKQLTATPTSKGTYDVWCDPQDDSCSITIDGGDDMVSRQRLPAYIPMASTTNNCTLEFCYNSNQDVIGLNPDYYLWKK
ncbi:hypothetical protein [Pseudomonas asiatica]|uniref:hypothetical protein n=1 Tax=Pseudomonas asiatica TaxID=2219225 RepID=UPI0025AAF634|nr:hypothetical protein [Pseudomonas asiatica]MDM9586906.1 hypothetical protein [Pseudomonas asiatica]